MREIKFRAWIKDENRMIYHPNILECCIQELDFSNVCRNYIQGTNPDEYERLTIPARITNRFYGKGLIELMQCTGLKDKNGRDICEGDIVKYVDNVSEDMHLYIVSFSNGCFYLESVEDSEYDDCIVCVFPIEVIGNIYENPELLE